MTKKNQVFYPKKPFIILYLSIFLFLSGCSQLKYPRISLNKQKIPVSTTLNSEQKNQIEALTQALMTLKAESDDSLNEAKRIAWSAVLYPFYLANQYQLTRPPLFHNSLVNAGIKKKGLCVDWTRDMMLHMQQLHLQHFDLHWGVAFLGDRLKEHNTLVITATKQAFEQGIILDPWRYSGKLFWRKLLEDQKYPWKKYR